MNFKPHPTHTQTLTVWGGAGVASRQVRVLCGHLERRAASVTAESGLVAGLMETGQGGLRGLEEGGRGGGRSSQNGEREQSEEN